MKTKKDLIKIIKEAHTKQIINHEEYLGSMLFIEGLNKELNADWAKTNHDIDFDYDEFKKSVKKGKVYENLHYDMFMKYLQELKSHKIQYQKTGNIFLETRGLKNGNWEISRTGLLSDVEDTVLTYILERHDITNNRIDYWSISSLKENWIHEVERLGLEEITINDRKSKGYILPISKILHHQKDYDEIIKREKIYSKKRIQDALKNKDK